MSPLRPAEPLPLHGAAAALVGIADTATDNPTAQLSLAEEGESGSGRLLLARDSDGPQIAPGPTPCDADTSTSGSRGGGGVPSRTQAAASASRQEADAADRTAMEAGAAEGGDDWVLGWLLDSE